MQRFLRSACWTVLGAVLVTVASGCVPPPSIKITSPKHGFFASAASSGVQVTGSIAQIDPADASVVVNGVPAQIDAAAKTFTAVVPFGPQRIFEPILAELTKVSTGKRFRDRIVVIREFDIGEATPVADAVALRLRQSALDDIAPIVSALLEEQMDLATLLPQEPIAAEGAIAQVLTDPPASFGALTVAFDTVAGALDVTTVLDDVFIAARVDKNTIPQLHCSLTVSIGSLTVKTRQELEPGGSDGETIAVQQIAASTSGEVVVTATGVASTADCTGPGLFDGTKERKIREKIQAFLVDGIAAFLADPDGPSEPLPAPIAAAVEGQLAGLNLSDVDVPGLRSNIEATFSAIDEQGTFVDARFAVDVDPTPTVAVPSGLNGARALPKADPDLTGSLRVPGVVPTFSAHFAYDIATGLSFSGLNRLLMAETESRRFQATIEQITTANGTQPFTAGTLAQIPEFGALPPATPLRAKVKATLAPVLTGKAGPHGELLEVAVGHVTVTIVKLTTNAQGQTSETELLKLAIDARAGLDVTIEAGALVATLGTLVANDIAVSVLSNPIGANETGLEVFGPMILASELPKVVDTSMSFPLPSFLDLAVQGNQVQRKDGYLLLFASLVPAP